MGFSYGTAPLILLLIALTTGGALLCSGRAGQEHKPDLTFLTFTKEHADAYQPVIEQFERENNVRIQLQVVSQGALQGRLQSAMQVGADVPDMVELLDGTLGIFTRGPIEDVGFIDLTERVKAGGLLDRVVRSRFSKWSSRNRIFAIPHDVHPLMLAYRRDLVQQLGIDVATLITWDDFCRVGRDVVTKDLDGDGVPDRYMLDLDAQGSDTLRFLLLQHGGVIFNPDGDVAFDDDNAADVIDWYIHQVNGPSRIAFPAGGGQNLSKAMLDGLVLFYFCPDWRLRQFENDVPSLAGKMALMRLPAWAADGIHTSTWGGTGLAITRQCKQPDLAWKLAMRLYYDPAQLGQRYAQTQILPPLKAAWQLPQFDAKNDYFSGTALGRVYADLADAVPAEQSSAYMSLAVAKLSEAYNNTLAYSQSHPGESIRDVARTQLKVAADRVRVIMGRNRFQQGQTLPQPEGR